ncbi:MerR family transcriptional regulator [Gordonia sp. NPDC127522]|uniref:MerR family transcriptional regulator n=1 Tax=Gordonia sp. NPDC127522 TaxID=3345390 RepID=UPI00363C2B8C
MRSGELAGLAGVSVRALRHYHQVGVLAEPARRSNGYRTYDVEDLVRVLRIKRLSSLGIPLDRMSGLLDDSAGAGPGATDSFLEDLDRELADQIARLREQRAAIAHLRTHRTSPDIPPELARYFAAYADAGVPAAVARVDRDGSVLLTHLVGADGMAELASFYERLSDPTIIGSVVGLIDEFGRLGADGAGHDSADDITNLVDRFLAVVAKAFADLPDPEPPIELGASARLLGELVEGRLNERQRQAIALLTTRLNT